MFFRPFVFFIFVTFILLQGLGQTQTLSMKTDHLDTSLPGSAPIPDSEETIAAVDDEQGDGSEGLSCYLLEHLEEEEKGRGWQYRKELLINYGASVDQNNEKPLRSYQKGEERSCQSAGSAKASMVFYMLRMMMGKERFSPSFQELLLQKSHQSLSWDELKHLFQKQTDQDLDGFFQQWIDEKALADLSVENASVGWSEDRYKIDFDMRQKGGPYSLNIPVTITFLNGESSVEWVKVNQEKETVSILVKDEPFQIALDQDYQIARKLHDSENPPILSRLFMAPAPLIILPEEDQRETYTEMMKTFKQRGGEEKNPSDIKLSDLKSSNLLVLGKENPLLRKLFGSVSMKDRGVWLQIRENPWMADKVIGILHAASREEADAALNGIFEYGSYSRISFSRGKVIDKHIEDSERGIKMELREKVIAAYDLSQIDTLSDVIEGVTEKRIIYVGENHDKVAHHQVQLEVIKKLHKKNPKLAIGMEMFQRPFQKALDDYISGTIDERTFLKDSDYFNSWGFDYNLYKPILDYARARKIPIAALNISREITRKIATEGVDSLTQEEKAKLPEEMDLSDRDYRDRLRKVFHRHMNHGKSNFDFFYQAQIVWDEIMAQSLDEFLRNYPEHQMVVIVGGGHLAFGSGVPKRAHRRNGYDYAIILNDVDIEKNVAHYVVYPQNVKPQRAPKLMALLNEKDGEITIAGFSKESVSEKAGLKKDDKILSLDGNMIDSVSDIKIALFYKKKNDLLKIKVMRKRFLSGNKEKEFEVKL